MNKIIFLDVDGVLNNVRSWVGMTNADNMFYSLGYDKMEKNNFIEYRKATIKIILTKHDKDVAKFDLGQGSYINMQELKAINEKVRELRMG